MTRHLRILDTGLAGAHRNVGLTAALLEAHARGEIPDTLRLHSYRTCILIGRSQQRQPAPSSPGAEVARRVTGGGDVAMTPGILAWDLVTPRRPWPSLDAASDALGQAVAAALASLGFAAAFRPPGEVALAGRKVAGLAGAFEGPTLLHQGSLLVEADLAELAGLLGRPTLPMTTLAAVGPVPAPNAIAAALATAFAEALHLKAAA